MMPKVTIIIPFRDRVDMLEKCVIGVVGTVPDRLKVEILLVDNGSGPTVKTFFEKIQALENIRVLKYPGQFNFSAINNFAAGRANGEFLLFLNNDTYPISEDWLTCMVDMAEKERVGAVGACLLYPDGTIQHAGVMLGKNVATHAFIGFHTDDELFVGHGEKRRRWSAVTAACMMTPRKLFLEAGGFDETEFPIAYNDVDYCLRLGRRGMETWVAPEAKLYHYESASRGSDVYSCVTDFRRYLQFRRERANMLKKWRVELKNDPYFDLRFLRRRDV
ncbi:MAG TPA: glycosyltransferase [Candidatus Fimivivens sp.]|nr:glycosyltransferase [Candidatus Fimivivens sp.]